MPYDESVPPKMICELCPNCIARYFFRFFYVCGNCLVFVKHLSHDEIRKIQVRRQVNAELHTS